MRTPSTPRTQRSGKSCTWFCDRGRRAGTLPSQWIESPSVAATGALMHHPGVSVILATGGNAMVRAAYSASNRALGVGAGNVPAYLHHKAKLARAVHDVVLSKSFDNGMVCASEQAGRDHRRRGLSGRARGIRQAARLPRHRAGQGQA